MRVGIIGAGPAGITAAYELSKRGVQVDVFEAADNVGGMARTIELWGQKVDLGPHRFFSSDNRVNKVWLEVIGRDYRMVDRLTRIYYKKKFFMYPLKAMNALGNLGIFEAARCFMSYVREKISPSTQDQSTFENWVVSRFGRHLFGIFFKTYSEKLWGISCQELDADFAAQRIKKLSLFEAIKNALFSGGSTKHKTLVDRFAFPLGGTGAVYERMATYVRNHDGQVFTNAPVKGVLVNEQHVTGIELADGRTHRYDHVISTMPLTLLVQSLPNVPAQILTATRELKFRNTLLVYLEVDAIDLFPDNWLYVHSQDLQVGRITNFRNWIPELYGDKKTSILTLEYWANDDDALWNEPSTASIARAEEELQRTGLIGNAKILGGHVHRVPRCYPVYRRGYREHVETVSKYLQGFSGITPIGRYGAFKYNNQDHSILMGIMAAENISQVAQNDLWSINTDYETYQEASEINETGLVLKPVHA
ncbi:MAG: FAD-dependent oxidoreductase [Bdellovibrionales bacterium]|nr:FAD-dependent oxidoreductase [Bdellovibrionales bacterium]